LGLAAWYDYRAKRRGLRFGTSARELPHEKVRRTIRR
jgi:hypothetical protein